MKRRMPEALRVWVEARRRFRLSHAHVQMARELGMNPKKLGKVDNADQEPWKAPLPLFIEALYRKRFGSDRPEVVTSVEERFRALEAKKAAKRAKKAAARAARMEAGPHGEQAATGGDQPAGSGAAGSGEDR